ncbi:hypothetical protein [Salinibacterium sp. ZJ454]|uniref:hypothetical protein n=1 Tax=Salinibacterium sp. ZJ454 TaxID=2708339 RepID=UPI00141EF31A|nr:hypothetical protein [Salinibacterium sp. ZJ454]
MPSKPMIRVIVVAAAVAALLSACTSGPAPTPSATPTPTPSQTAPAASGDGVLRIGTQTDAAAGGGAIVAGAELAVREINLAGGVNGAQVVLFHRGVAETATADLVAKGADVILAGPGVAAADLLLISVEPSETPDDELAARLAQIDPGVSDFTGAVESYHQTVRAALAAVVAGDDGAESLRFGLDAVSAGSTECSSFGECSAALADGFSVTYTLAH